MKNLRKILENVEYELVKGSLDIEIKDIKNNSRSVEPDDLFIAIVGTTADSHTFIPDAIQNGATVVVIEKEVEITENITVIKVASSRKALAYMSAAYFDYPAKELTTIGITGTAGKTSTSYMLKAMLERQGKKVGLIGTICALIGDKKIELHNTTPESYDVQKMFRQMIDAGCQYALMEVSSQGLKMHRVDGFTFDYGVFTNISPEHIGPNEHESFEEYLYCKSLLFQKCRIGIINTDSNRWQDVVKNHTCEIITYGASEQKTDIKASNIEFIMENDFLGMGFTVSGKLEGNVKVSIPGRFSVYNSLCAMTIANELGVSLEHMKEALENVKVTGRMELASSNENYKLIIDYAHNEDEMNNLMDTISEYQPERLVCIFGGGGNRAKARRYDMGEVAGKWADLIILTEDNPRWEELDSINQDIIEGIRRSQGKYIIVNNRKEAIKYAMQNAEKGDMILLIGKGHENYQEIRGVRYPWDERKAVKEAEQELENTAK